MTYRVTLRDASLASVGEVQCDAVDVVARLSDVGTWVVSLPTYVLPLIGPGGGVIIRRDGNVLMTGPYTAVTYVKDSGHLDGALTLSGVSDEIVLQDRVCYQLPGSVFGSQTESVDTRSGTAEAVIYAYVNVNAGPGAIVARRVSGMTLGTSLGRGATVQQAPDTGMNLLTLVKSLADANNLAVRVRQSGTSRVFEVFAPTDYSGTVRFSRALDNLNSIAYTATAPVATRELVHNGGVFVEVSDASSETTWHRRIEHDVAGSTADATTLAQDGTNQLAQDVPTTQLTVSVLETATAGYGRPWVLGDKVTVIADVTELADFVREIHFHADSGGEVITPTIGTPNATATSATGQALNDLITRINRLEGKV